MERSLVDALLEDDAFYDMHVQCPECKHIEDEQYTCTTCWCEPGVTHSVTSIIEALRNGKLE